MVQEIPIKPKQRWEVVFEENGKWRCGIYVPEYSSRNEVKYLEKHNAPELFLLVKGKIILLLSEDSKNVVEKPMEEGKIYIVTEWHNAYRPNGCEGVALVIERLDIETEYAEIKVP